MEQILDELKSIKQLLTTLPPAPVQRATPDTVLIPVPAAQTPAAAPQQPHSADIIPLAPPNQPQPQIGALGSLMDLGGLPPTLPEKVVTDADITDLIQPHLSNPALKAAFQGVIQQMGIARLPEAKPEQYSELHQRFSQAIEQATAGQQQGAAKSII
jgi:hypothetical protein